MTAIQIAKLITCLLLLSVMNPPQTLAEGKMAKETPGPEPFSDLNLRFSNRPLDPPENLIVQTVPLTDFSVATAMVAPSPQAVIFENDLRQRLAVLTQDETGPLTLFLLAPLPLDPKLPSLVQCAHDRRCETDRTPLTGGLGCLALCLKEQLEAVATNPLPR